MKLEQSFEVDAPIEQVWSALIDVERVAPCLPGASITGHDEEGIYRGEFQVKLGPTTAAYRGTVRIESADESARIATLAARGTDKRGQGGASATIVNKLSEREGGGTRVDTETDFTITGRLASFGRGGMMKDISKRLLRDFAACLQQRLAAQPAGVAEGKSPAEVSGEPAPPGTVATPPQAAPQPAPPTPVQPSAPPVKGLSLFFSVLWERIRNVFRRR
jgi:carbon monoxide dehydrogenase subunit G